MCEVLGHTVHTLTLVHIGKVCANYLQMEEKAIKYFLRSVDLTATMKPKDPTDEEWYKDADKYINAHRVWFNG